MRMAEIEEARHVINMINDGDGLLVAQQNLRRKGHKGSSSHGLEGVDWARWMDRIEMGNTTALGHSFGAATCVEMLRHNDRFNWITQGIIFDIWG